MSKHRSKNRICRLRGHKMRQLGLQDSCRWCGYTDYTYTSPPLVMSNAKWDLTQVSNMNDDLDDFIEEMLNHEMARQSTYIIDEEEEIDFRTG